MPDREDELCSWQRTAARGRWRTVKRTRMRSPSSTTSSASSAAADRLSGSGLRLRARGFLHGTFRSRSEIFYFNTLSLSRSPLRYHKFNSRSWTTGIKPRYAYLLAGFQLNQQVLFNIRRGAKWDLKMNSYIVSTCSSPTFSTFVNISYHFFQLKKLSNFIIQNESFSITERQKLCDSLRIFSRNKFTSNTQNNEKRDYRYRVSD